MPVKNSKNERMKMRMRVDNKILILGATLNSSTKQAIFYIEKICQSFLRGPQRRVEGRGTNVRGSLSPDGDPILSQTRARQPVSI